MFWSDQKLEWTGVHERTLRALAVDEDGPGTVLHDFQMLLSYVRERELPVSKAHQLPPLQALPEINARLAHPVTLGLKRPQLKSYPHIQGLYLLLRASGLGSICGTPSKPVLAINEVVHNSWNGLNPTERYFTLLETWLLRGYPEIAGEQGTRFHSIGRYYQDCRLDLFGTGGWAARCRQRPCWMILPLFARAVWRRLAGALCLSNEKWLSRTFRDRAPGISPLACFLLAIRRSGTENVPFRLAAHESLQAFTEIAEEPVLFYQKHWVHMPIGVCGLPCFYSPPRPLALLQ
jgi:hypothetical protein